MGYYGSVRGHGKAYKKGDYSTGLVCTASNDTGQIVTRLSRPSDGTRDLAHITIEDRNGTVMRDLGYFDLNTGETIQSP